MRCGKAIATGAPRVRRWHDDDDPLGHVYTGTGNFRSAISKPGKSTALADVPGVSDHGIVTNAIKALSNKSTDIIPVEPQDAEFAFLDYLDFQSENAFNEALSNLSKNAHALAETVFLYIQTWRKTFSATRFANRLYPAVQLVLKVTATTHIAAALDDIKNRVWHELHELCEAVMRKSCEDVLNASLFRPRGYISDNGFKKITRFFTDALQVLGPSKYVILGEDSPAFINYVEDQLKVPREMVESAMRTVLESINIANNALSVIEKNKED